MKPAAASPCQPQVPANPDRSVAIASLGTMMAWLALLTAGAQVARAESAAAPWVEISNVSVQEGNNGETPFTAQVRLSWSTAMDVEISATPETATQNDYRFATVKMKILGAGVQTVSGVILGDLDPEGDETFRLVVTTPNG